MTYKTHFSMILTLLFIGYLLFISVPQEKKDEIIISKLHLNEDFYFRVDEHMVLVTEDEFNSYQLGSIYPDPER
jgi:hypothetical protein